MNSIQEDMEAFREGQWAGYSVLTPARGIDSIIECDLAKDFDFSDPDALTSRIETAAAAFIADIERFLSKADLNYREEAE